MKISKFLAFTLVLAICISFLLADAFAGTGRRTGTAGAQELLIPVSAAGAALGGANIANVKGIDAVFWNPAGLAASSHSGEAMFSHMNYIADINMNYVAANFNAGGLGTLGFDIKTLDFGDIPVTTEESPDGTGEMFSPNFITLGLTYSRTMTDRIHFGVNAKFVSEKVMQVAARGLAFDLGLQYTTTVGVRAGVVLKNIGTNMKFDGNDLEVFTKDVSDRPDANGKNTRLVLASFELPVSYELGLAYDYKIGELNTLSMMGTFMNNNFSLDEYRLAAEYNYNNFVFLRGSYLLGYDADEDKIRVSDEDAYLWGPSFGGGINLSVGASMGIKFDYAYRVTALFDNNQWFSMTLTF